MLLKSNQLHLLSSNSPKSKSAHQSRRLRSASSTRYSPLASSPLSTPRPSKNTSSSLKSKQSIPSLFTIKTNYDPSDDNNMGIPYDQTNKVERGKFTSTQRLLASKAVGAKNLKDFSKKVCLISCIFYTYI